MVGRNICKAIEIVLVVVGLIVAIGGMGMVIAYGWPQ
jgi:hypothetical protein